MMSSLGKGLRSWQNWNCWGLGWNEEIQEPRWEIERGWVSVCVRERERARQWKDYIQKNGTLINKLMGNIFPTSKYIPSWEISFQRPSCSRQSVSVRSGTRLLSSPNRSGSRLLQLIRPKLSLLAQHSPSSSTWGSLCSAGSLLRLLLTSHLARAPRPIRFCVSRPLWSACLLMMPFSTPLLWWCWR